MANGSVAGVVAFAVLLTCYRASTAAVYKVGDSAGWTTIGNVDYKKWAATKSFKLGDVIHFEYNPQFHNVMQVKHPDYRACNASSPIATHTTGNDTITVTAAGHHYFLCGVPGHCQSGQKVDINVLRLPSSSMPPTLSPSSSSSSSVPAVASVAAPSPSKATTASLMPFHTQLLFVAFPLLLAALL